MLARVLAGRKLLGAQRAPKRLVSRVDALVHSKITQLSIRLAALAALVRPPTRVRQRVPLQLAQRPEVLVTLVAREVQRERGGGG